MRRWTLTLTTVGMLMGTAAPAIGPGPATPASPALRSAQSLPPSLVYGSLLSGLILETSGEMRFDTLWAYFLPAPASGQYIPDGDDLHAVLRHKGGGEAAHFKFYAGSDKPPLWQLSNYTLEDKEGEQTGIIYRIKPGNYVLDWYVAGTHFMTFPFCVATLGSNDPYAPDAAYVIDGAWEDMACLYVEKNRADVDIQFRYWLRDRCKGANRQAMVRVEVRRGGKLIAENTTNPQGTETTMETKWGRVDTTFSAPKQGPRWVGKDLLVDGVYEVTVKIDGKPHGRYPYEVKGGKVVLTGRQVRGSADPKVTIEGGPDTYWIERQK